MKSLLAGLSLVSLAVLPLAAQSLPVWSHAAPSEIAFFRVTPLGNVVVATPGRLTALDPATGAASWVYEHSQPGSFTEVRETPYALFDFGDRIELIDLGTGAKQWSSEALGVASLKGHLAVPERGLLLVHAGGGPDSSVLLAVELASGQVRWRHARPFVVEPKRYRALTSSESKSDNALQGEQPAVWVNDSAFLLHVSEDGPTLLNANTGAVVWRADSLKGERPPALRDAYPLVLVADSVVFVPYEKKLQAIRLRDGTPLWAKAVEFPSRVIQLEMTPRGMLVRGARREFDANRDDPFVQLLNPVTGASAWRWKKGRGVLNGNNPPPGTSPFIVRGGRVYFAWDGDLYAITLDNGSATKLGKVKFKGAEDPVIVENRPDGILLWSAQNRLLVDSGGAVRYQSYNPAPPIGLLGHLASVALRVALDVASYSLAESQARRTGAPQTYTQFEHPFLRIRYAAAADAAAYVYILTSEPDASGEKRSALIWVPKDRDAVEGRVWLSEKNPAFEVDPFTAMVYVQTGPREISAFKF
jgi:outer membrane protein assembly factor BamB